MKNNKPDDWKKRLFVDPRNIELKPNGMRLESPHHMNQKGQPEHLKGKVRGTIKGWSKHSRKRMRDAILDTGVPEGLNVYAVTLTVPGDKPFTPEEAKQAWKWMQVELKDMSTCGFWRLELQKRGMVHWHLLLCASSSASQHVDAAWHRVLDRFETPVSVTHAQYDYLRIHNRDGWRDDQWESALDIACDLEGFTVDYDKRSEFNTLVLPLSRSEIKGAAAKACQIDQSDGHVGWLRYMNDHCTKAKQEQVVGFEGVRHWGYINKKMLPPASGSREALSYAEAIAVLRIISKWGRPRIRAKCSFGCKLGFRSSRGRRGASVWFGSPEFFERVLSFARENPASLSPRLLPADQRASDGPRVAYAPPADSSVWDAA